MTSKSPPLLRGSELVKDYPGLRALDRVDFQLLAGEIHALVGQNGAGKSTLIKILTGVIQPDAGHIHINGEPVTFRSTADAFSHGISVLHQELSIVPHLSAAENIYLGRLYPGRFPGMIDWKTVNNQAQKSLDKVGARFAADTPVSRLRAADRTLVAMARALFIDSKILILDEPTASLTDEETEKLFHVLRQLKAEGTGIIYVSHRLPELFQIADRMTVLRDGKVVTVTPTDQTDAPGLVKFMTGLHSQSLFPPRAVQKGPVCLSLRGIQTRRQRDITFDLHQGEIIGIAGLTGSGRSCFLRSIIGAEKILAGDMLLNGEKVRFRSPKHAFQKGVALAPEERRYDGLILNSPVRDNMTLAHLRHFSKGGFWINRKAEKAVSDQLVKRLDIRLKSLNQPVWQLSGGNQQKIVLGKLTARPLSVLLLDEPTRGIDIGAKREFYRHVTELTQEGTAIIVVSSELDELMGLADRIIVFHDGEVTLDISAEETPEKSMAVPAQFETLSRRFHIEAIAQAMAGREVR